MWLDRLNRRFGSLALPHLTVVVLLGQVLFFLIRANSPETLNLVSLDFGAVIERGEVWRLVTFLFIPPMKSALFILFAWYLFYLMGTALENHWGTFRFNLFIFAGWLGTVAASVVDHYWGGGGAMTNAYLLASVYLAFAYLYPEFQLMILFILPVRIKWLALLMWIGYFFNFATADEWTERFAVVAAVANFLLFFGFDLLGTVRHANRSMLFRTAAIRAEREPRHVCRVCGANDKEQPELDFRYCTDCKPATCYCPKHLDLHAHLKEPRT